MIMHAHLFYQSMTDNDFDELNLPKQIKIIDANIAVQHISSFYGSLSTVTLNTDEYYSTFIQLQNYQESYFKNFVRIFFNAKLAYYCSS